jgi:Cu+-exporting ATPase
MAACCAVAAYLVMRVLSMNKALGLESIFPANNACKTYQDNTLCTSRLNIKGITCAACVDTIQQSLEGITGVFSAPVSIITSQAVVIHGASVPLGDLVRKIEDLGYDAEESGGNTISDDDIEEADRARASSIEQWRKLLIGSAICTFVMEITARVPASSRSYWSPMSQTLLQASTCSLVVLVFGHPIHREAITALRYWRLDMSLLASLGTLLAYLRAIHIIASHPSKHHRQNLSLFESTALLMTVIVGGRFLKSTLMRQSLLSLNALRMHIPESATLVHGDQGSEKLETVSIAEVKKNDCLLIYPGGIIPADGIVVRGVGFVAETHLNGEILPIKKSAGSEVFAGSVNQDGLLFVKVAQMGSSSWVQHILKLMLDANLRKSTTQELVDFVTGWFVGVILVIASSTGAWYFLAGYTVSTSIDRVIAILLCACPCALGLASPTAVVVGIGENLLNKARFLELIGQ